MVQFNNKTVLITGAGSGIGEAIAYQFAKRGSNVILSGLGREALDKVKDNCEKMGVTGFVCEVNLEDHSSIDGLVEFIWNNRLKPDFIVLNAGISQRAKALETDFSIDKKLMEINYLGSVYLIKQMREFLLTAKMTHIAVTTSISGIFGFPMRSAYCASKRALFGFFESLELEYPNIKVTFLIPGRINTQISKSAITSSGEAYQKMDPGQATGLDVNVCAKRALKAISKEKHKVLIGKKELLMVYIYKYCSPIFYKLARKVSAT